MNMRRVGLYALISLLTFLVMVPLLWMLSVSLRTNVQVFSIPLNLLPPSPDLDAYKQIFAKPDMIRLFLNSYIVAFAVTLLCIFLSALSGYGLSRYQYKGKRFIILYVLLTQMFPMVLLCIPYFLIISRMGLYNTYTALILAYTSFALPFSMLMMRDFVNSIPRELDEAATMDGCGAYRTFFRLYYRPACRA